MYVCNYIYHDHRAPPVAYRAYTSKTTGKYILELKQIFDSLGYSLGCDSISVILLVFKYIHALQKLILE